MFTLYHDQRHTVYFVHVLFIVLRNSGLAMNTNMMMDAVNVLQIHIPDNMAAKLQMVSWSTILSV